MSDTAIASRDELDTASADEPQVAGTDAADTASAEELQVAGTDAADTARREDRQVASIDRVIFHWLARDGDGPTDVRLSSDEADLTGAHGEAVVKYLKEHITKSLEDSATIAADFRGPDAEQETADDAGQDAAGDAETEVDVRAAIERVLSDGEFVASTQTIAERTGAIMSGDRRIPAGTLAFALYTKAPDQPSPRDATDATDATDGEGGETDASIEGTDARPVADDAPRLAILKLDQTVQFRVAESSPTEGRVKIVLEELKDVLPSVRERLQKCAFVRAPGTGVEPYRIRSLDRQTKGEKVAHWFLKNLLSAESVSTDESRTRAFYQGCNAGRRAVQNMVPLAVSIQLDDARDQELRGTEIDVPTFIANLPGLSAAQKALYRTAMTTRMVDGAVTVHRPAADKLLARKAKFTGDHALTLTVAKANLTAVLDVAVGLEFDPGTGRHFVKLWTEKWDRVE